jgi:sugar lactone lactonase YvrE
VGVVTARFGLLLSVVVVFGIAVSGALAGSGPGLTTVASGLDNPRGLEVGPGGAVYVAEAGRGGDFCVGSGPEGRTCIGFTAAVTRIAGGTQQRVATGLLSVASPDGSFATGADDVALSGRGIYVVMTSAPPGAVRGVPASIRRQLGHLLRVRGPRHTPVANVGRIEVRHNPDGTDVNPNPYGLVAAPRGSFFVADAGGNTILRVDRSGLVSIVAVLPPETVPRRGQAQSVPTAITWGPDGALYVGELGGGNMPADKARIFRIDPFGLDDDEDDDVDGDVEVFATGFTAISGLDFAPDGTLYVTEQFRSFAALGRGDLTGRLIRIAPNGRRTELARGRLIAPGGVAVGPGKTVYVSTGSLFAGQGAVVRIRG